VRIAGELWLVDPVVASQRLIASDSQVRGRAAVSASAAGRVYVVDDDTLSPELWLEAPAGTSPRLLLNGANEYFSAPELAPDGRRFVFVRTPSGSETDDTSAVWQGDLSGAAPRVLIVEAHLPAWSPDGIQLAFQHDGDVYLVESTIGLMSWPAVTPPTLNPQATLFNPQSLSPPATIRVIHTQGNANCRQQHFRRLVWSLRDQPPTWPRIPSLLPSQDRQQHDDQRSRQDRCHRRPG
jgi:WD40 repeat protein